MLQEYFGTDFFLEVIEEEYGISPGENDAISIQIHDHFEKYIDNYREA